MKTLAERIRWARLESGLKQADVAKSLKVSSSAVNQWERGTSKTIKLEYFFVLANLLEQDPQWLGTGEIAPPSENLSTTPTGKKVLQVLDNNEKVVLANFRALSPYMRQRLMEFTHALADVTIHETPAEYNPTASPKKSTPKK